MTTTAWIRIAGVLVALAVAAIALVAVPPASWTLPAVIALVLLAHGAAFVFWAPAIYAPAPGSDATRIALIGPLIVQAAVLILLAAFALAQARSYGGTATVWTLDVLYVAVLVIGTVLLKASASAAEGAAARTAAIKAAPKSSDQNW